MITKLEELQEKVNFWLHWLASSYIGSTNTATSAKNLAGSLTCTNSTVITTEMGTTYSDTTQRTSDGVIERLDSLKFWPPKTRIFNLSRFRKLVSSVK